MSLDEAEQDTQDEDRAPGGADTPPGEAPAIIVGVRLFVLILAAAAVAVAAAAVVRGAMAASGRGEARYICPMHPEVRSAAPGECPICRMALEPAHGLPTGAHAGHDMAVSSDIAAVENIRKHNIVEFVRRRSLLPNLRDLRGPASVGDDGAIVAVMYNDQIAALAPDEAATFHVASSRDEYAVRRAAGQPVAWDRSTSRVRFQVAAATTPSPLRPGQAGWVEVPRKAREVLGVPTSALLQSPDGPYVLRWVGGRRFEKRPVRVAETFLKQGFAVVLSGLGPQDRVVSRAAFFVDADRRLGNHTDGEEWGAP